MACLGLALCTIAACTAKKKAAYTKTANGLEYMIVKDVPGGQKPAIGDYMEFHIRSYVKTPKGDSLLFDSRTMNGGNPVPYQVAAPSFKGDISEGFTFLTEGDSANFLISVDSMLKAGTQALTWMKPGTFQKINYSVQVTKVRSQEELQKEKAESAGKQAGVDEALVREYLTKNGIQATRTASGLYYRIEKMGAGLKPGTGDSVSMNYTGMTLAGEKFDSNVDPKFNHVMPFWFTLGMGQVISGWDEGIALMPKGSKGTLYIPSTLAYGAQSPTPLIQPNSVLVFDVEVVDVRKGR